MKITSKDIFSKLFSADANAAISEIFLKMESRESSSYFPVIVHFLYFANAEMRKLFEPKKRNRKDEEYLQTLLSGDILLPDGIALALLYFRSRNPKTSPLAIVFRYSEYADMGLSNLNGTDFLPQFLSEAKFRFPHNVSVYLYGGFPEIIERAAKKVELDFGIRCGFQEGYSPFDFKKFHAFPGEKKILLVWMGSPKQEIWIAENIENLSNASVVFSVGGLFDFWGGLEKRAPKIIRRIRVEWFWRLLTSPVKNFRKATVSLKFFPRFFSGKF